MQLNEVGLTIFLVTVLVGVGVAVLVTVCLWESRDLCSGLRLRWRLVQKLLKFLLIHLPGRRYNMVQEVRKSILNCI